MIIKIINKLLLSLLFKLDKEIVINEFFNQIKYNKIFQSHRELFFTKSFDLIRFSDLNEKLISIIEEKVSGKITYSQEGEDLVLNRLLNLNKKGFFVDVGANHPTRFSNTYMLYRRGWHGINIDATPRSMDLFNIYRKRDINLELAVSDSKKKLQFNAFNETALNTFDCNLAKEYTDKGYSLKSQITLTTNSLADILDKYLLPGQNIDLLSIDVEGEDFNVLKSNNWDKYSPGIVVIEILEISFDGLDSSPEIKFLKNKGYQINSRLFNSVILTKIS